MTADSSGPVAGRSVTRVDALAKVTGRAGYAVDHRVPGCLHARVVRSQRAHARLAGISRDAALAVPGCVAVITAEDLLAAAAGRRGTSPLFLRFGHVVPDHAILAHGKVRYYGEPVAVVVAQSPYAAYDAAELVEVGYEDLPALMSPASALAQGAPAIHEQRYAGDSIMPATASGEESGRWEPNVAYQAGLAWGDATAALACAPVVVESSGHFPMLYAYPMEPYNAVADFRDGTLEVTSCAQHPFQVERDLARVFGLPLNRVRVQVPYIGGGYGAKSYTKIEPLTALAAWYTRRPVKLVLDIEESIYTTRADSADVTVRSGFDRDGTLIVRQFDITLDTGAYLDNSAQVLEKSVNRCFGPYRIPHLQVSARAVYTTTSPASSYRGFGAAHCSFASETNMDRAAAQLGIDPVELRRRNLVARGEELLPGRRPMDTDLADDLAVLREAITGYRPSGGRALRATGVSCTVADAGALPSSTAQVRILSDGSVMLHTGATEMGQGSHTVLCQIVAQELGVPLDLVLVAPPDTLTSPFERTTGASRTTTIVGTAVQRACQDALEKVARMAAEIDGPGTVARDRADAQVIRGSADFAKVIRAWFGPGGGEVAGIGVVRKAGNFAQLPPFWEVGMVAVQVAIDPDTGQLDVEHLVTIGDVGKALNPVGVEGQDLGAATQGLGGALWEELIYDGQQIANANIIEYRVPRISDMPGRIDTILIERGDGPGPYGSKGVGEGARGPMGGAVASAVAAATGVWPDRLPLTPERIWRLCQEGKATAAPGEPVDGGETSRDAAQEAGK
ncbi:MAG TPA: xanthine dehydrogenase family protein molybdopterin-binding subunit [Trebonia sp.]|jgi:CO/xanthine dehydrogenase Mo-binding subunit